MRSCGGQPFPYQEWCNSPVGRVQAELKNREFQSSMNGSIYRSPSGAITPVARELAFGSVRSLGDRTPTSLLLRDLA